MPTEGGGWPWSKEHWSSQDSLVEHCDCLESAGWTMAGIDPGTLVEMKERCVSVAHWIATDVIGQTNRNYWARKLATGVETDRKTCRARNPFQEGSNLLSD